MVTLGIVSKHAVHWFLTHYIVNICVSWSNCRKYVPLKIVILIFLIKIPFNFLVSLEQKKRNFGFKDSRSIIFRFLYALHIPENFWPPAQSTVTGLIKCNQIFLVTLYPCQNGDPLPIQNVFRTVQFVLDLRNLAIRQNLNLESMKQLFRTSVQWYNVNVTVCSLSLNYLSF